jgi:hypothetical protein
MGAYQGTVPLMPIYDGIEDYRRKRLRRWVYIFARVIGVVSAIGLIYVTRSG